MSTTHGEDARSPGLATRSRGKLFALSAATILALYLCYRLAAPFMPALVWAVTAAVVTHRFSRWLDRYFSSPSAKAAIGVTVVAIAILLPALWLAYMGAQQVQSTIEELQKPETQQTWNRWLKSHPDLQQAWTALTQDFDPVKEAPQLIERLQPGTVSAVWLPLYVGAQLLLMLFVLFYLYRDEQEVLAAARRSLPLSDDEVSRLFRRLDDTIHATIYGIVVVSMIQGALGGLMFWLLGLRGAVLWGLVMALLAIIPYLGAFVVWAPAAAFLALQGEWGKALMLAGWGTIIVGLIDNLLYPILVGQRLRLHTVVAFVAILGGIAVFGATGVVLGPVIVATAIFLLDVWRRRTAHGAPAERA